MSRGVVRLDERKLALIVFKYQDLAIWKWAWNLYLRILFPICSKCFASRAMAHRQQIVLRAGALAGHNGTRLDGRIGTTGHARQIAAHRTCERIGQPLSQIDLPFTAMFCLSLIHI